MKPAIGGRQLSPMPGSSSANQNVLSRGGVNQSQQAKNGVAQAAGTQLQSSFRAASPASTRQHLDTKPQLPLGNPLSLQS